MVACPIYTLLALSLGWRRPSARVVDDSFHNCFSNICVCVLETFAQTRVVQPTVSTILPSPSLSRLSFDPWTLLAWTSPDQLASGLLLWYSMLSYCPASHNTPVNASPPRSRPNLLLPSCLQSQCGNSAHRTRSSCDQVHLHYHKISDFCDHAHSPDHPFRICTLSHCHSRNQTPLSVINSHSTLSRCVPPQLLIQTRFSSRRRFHFQLSAHPPGSHLPCSVSHSLLPPVPGCQVQGLLELLLPQSRLVLYSHGTSKTTCFFELESLRWIPQNLQNLLAFRWYGFLQHAYLPRVKQEFETTKSKASLALSCWTSCRGMAVGNMWFSKLHFPEHSIPYPDCFQIWARCYFHPRTLRMLASVSLAGFCQRLQLHCFTSASWARHPVLGVALAFEGRLHYLT